MVNPREVVGTYTVRAALYSIKMNDKRSLFPEIHLTSSMMRVDVVIGKTQEATAMILIMNKTCRDILN